MNPYIFYRYDGLFFRANRGARLDAIQQASVFQTDQGRVYAVLFQQGPDFV